MTSTEKLHFVDLETTGANQINDRITEIGIITVDIDGNVDRWSSFVNPGISIPSFIQQLTGIDDDMVANAPPFATVADELQSRLADGLFIAHNVRFDYGFLHQAFLRNDQALQSDMLCTVRLSRALFPEEKKHNLDTLIARHALVPQARHRALADADLLWQLWRKLGNTLPSEVFAQAVSKLRQRPKPVDTVPAALATARS
ncbi:MAG TPA: 3'-5' exonuclease [Oxalicibacterium sp.]|uniref:3'-5' exonuclease n=1 Tax=Oxalicibacterium sp. TaxID=2766525 RepID=UPI002C1C4D53|nr:3'-5' exonuclease [Oxalicibacterium sp.]HWU97121.1 3'-5' exonuclease [Oxalicibacterium sp.]